jgi:hypothetical protein
MERMSFRKLLLLVVAGLITLTVIASCAVAVTVLSPTPPVQQEQFEMED